MSEYTRIQSEISKLQQRAAALRKKEINQVITNIKKAIRAYGLTAGDLGLEAKPAMPGPKSGRGRSEKKICAPRQKRRISKTAKNRAGKSGGIDRRSMVAPKFRDATTGATWTGRGKQPKWLAAAIEGGKKLDDFRI